MTPEEVVDEMHCCYRMAGTFGESFEESIQWHLDEGELTPEDAQRVRDAYANLPSSEKV